MVGMTLGACDLYRKFKIRLNINRVNASLDLIGIWAQAFWYTVRTYAG